MIEKTNAFGNRVLLFERYDEFRRVLAAEGYNVLYAGTETHDFTTYFRITLRK